MVSLARSFIRFRLASVLFPFGCRQSIFPPNQQQQQQQQFSSSDTFAVISTRTTPITRSIQHMAMASGTTTTAATPNDDNDDNDSNPTKSTSTLQLDEYLEQVLNALTNNNNASSSSSSSSTTSGATLTITKQHRKTMMRCLLGMKKVEFDQQIRDYRTQQDWKDVEDFCEQHLKPMLLTPSEEEEESLSLLLLNLEELAPNFRNGLETYQGFATHTKPKDKVFASLARGRTYQGKLERLLEVHKPDLLPLYREIVPDKNTNDKDEKCKAVNGFVASKVRDSTIPKATRQSLQACLDFKFPSSTYDQPADGGKASGLKSEVDLVTYLTRRHHQQQRNNTDMPTTTNKNNNDNEEIMILAPVYIVHDAKARNKKRCRYALQVPKSVDVYGMTAEWDAVVVRRRKFDPKQPAVREGQLPALEILQVWESKSTLHIVTIPDVIRKKYDSMRWFFGTTNDDDDNNDNVDEDKSSSTDKDNMKIWIDDEPYDLISSSSSIPDIGIFGSTLWSPTASARLAKSVACESLLEKTSWAVDEALRTGSVRIEPGDDYNEIVVKPLRTLLELAREIQPTLVVGSKLETVDDDDDDNDDDAATIESSTS